MLADCKINIEGKCSQTALTVVALITYNISTMKRHRMANLDNRHHDKDKETSINIYFRLELYSTITNTHRLFVSTWYMRIVQ